jgi:hypothetical protein
MESQWTPSRSKISQKFHYLGIYANCRACREKPNFYTVFSYIMPLTCSFLLLLRHDIPFQWDGHAQISFVDLKYTLSNSPLISPPDYNRDYILYLSASVVSVVGVLIQLGADVSEHVIYYISKNLSGPPLKYNHNDKIYL